MAKRMSEKDFEKGLTDEKEKEKIFKKNTISRETIQRKLKEMVNEGLVKKDRNRYLLSELVLSDFRYFNPDLGRNFGNLLLNALLQLHYPTIDDFKTNVKNLIEIFGFYLLYLLIESCRPIKIQNNNKYIENSSKDALTEKWFEKALGHQHLLDMFICAVTNQYNEEQRKEYFEKHYKMIDEDHGCFDYIKIDDPHKSEFEKEELIHIVDPMSTDDFWLRRFYYLTSKECEFKYKTTSSPLYEINQDLADQIDKILIELFPNYYKIASLAKLAYEKPKEESVSNKVPGFQ